MKKRPAFYWRTARIGVPSVIIASTILMARGLVWEGVGLVAVGLVGLFVPWLLSPYNKTARWLVAPSDEQLDRSVRLADRLGSVPLFGVLWRFAERLSGDVGRKNVEEYRRWRREHQDE